MKKPFDITLTTLHVGTVQRVVTLGMDGKDAAAGFLRKLEKKDKKTYRKLAGSISLVADLDHYENDVSFKSLGSGLFEFKIHKPAIRLYVFYDRNLLGEESLILAAHGGPKKSQQVDIKKALERKRAYEQALTVPKTTVTLVK